MLIRVVGKSERDNTQTSAADAKLGLSNYTINDDRVCLFD